MVTARDSLAYLGNPVAVKLLLQFRLAYQYDLEELGGVGLKVGQQSELFQNLHVQILCLVNYEYGRFPLGMGVE